MARNSHGKSNVNYIWKEQTQ